MAKWADYCISKMSFNENGKTITEVFVYEDLDSSIREIGIKDRNWMEQKITNGKTFCHITKTIEGKWRKVGDFTYENGSFKWTGTLPKVLTRRKTFVSYYHKDDESYRKRFDNLFDDLLTPKSVKDNDIDGDNSDDYIKQLIHKDYLSDVTVLVVLVGPKSKCRKHIDWEIAGALNHKVGDNYAGLIGILLPSHPDYGKDTYNSDNLPKRLAANVKSGYAMLYDWSDDRVKMQNRIEKAFTERGDTDKLINKSIPQMKNNTCD